MSISRVFKTLGKLSFIAIVAVLPNGAFASAAFYGPTPYLSPRDSPFYGTTFSYFHLEDFEDGLLNTPGVTATAG